MWFFKKQNNAQQELEQAKNDIYRWLTFLKQKSDYQEQKIDNLSQELTQTRQISQQIIDHEYKIRQIIDHINHLRLKIVDLSKQDAVPPQNIQHLQDRVNQLEQKKDKVRLNLREKLVEKVAKNSKNYIKNTIFSLIRKYNKITAFQLKEIIVDEQGLCSKSSFYRLLQEIENDHDIGTIKDGKEKTYIINLQKTI